MQQTAAIDDRGVRQSWYDCPVCAAHHTVVQPCEVRLQRFGNLQRCNSGWPDHGQPLPAVR
ncbi:MAG: hypothetical protein QNJ91_16220 [Gammaproteobacteria bacterium]|nr:hypothetical protein [Gammaproteobacteria bacterium]